jgi:hypothetical protein
VTASVRAIPRSTDRGDRIRFELSRHLTEGEIETVLSRLMPHPCIKAVEASSDQEVPGLTVTAWSSEGWMERDRKRNVPTIELIERELRRFPQVAPAIPA